VKAVIKRLLLIDPTDARREVLARRLHSQGYTVEAVGDPATGADLALSAPPEVIVADLWMPSISGVQLCRLLKSEPATADVPIILCGERDEPKNRFWAEHAGAAAFVIKGRTAELVRVIAKAVDREGGADGFFVQLAGGSVDIRDRIARHLDAALFEAVISAELRSLASATSFERLFDNLAQLMSRITRYRWIALATVAPVRVAIHHHPAGRAAAESEARVALACAESTPLITVEDEDPIAEEQAVDPIVCSVSFASGLVARFAMGPSAANEGDAPSLARIVARELGGAVKIAELVEESQRLATTDALTDLSNRRAFESAIRAEHARCRRHGYPLSFALLDIDFFKQINDKRGHAAGDRVLAGLGALLRRHLRASDLAARWGGEEFVMAFTSTDLPGARTAAERLRSAVEEMLIRDDEGERIPVSASIGIATLHSGEAWEKLMTRADHAMYAAKHSGRNRVCVCADDMDTASEILSSEGVQRGLSQGVERPYQPGVTNAVAGTDPLPSPVPL
jgi:two-component system, cell cycle response regulator